MLYRWGHGLHDDAQRVPQRGRGCRSRSPLVSEHYWPLQTVQRSYLGCGSEPKVLSYIMTSAFYLKAWYV
jgi:hypothetical protein